MRAEKVPFMKRLIPLILLIILSFIGCASLAARNRMIDFETISKEYRHAFQLSEFTTAYQFIDPAVVKNELDVAKLKDTKIVKYKVINTDLAKDAFTVKQNVDIEYYQLDRLVLQTIQGGQLWKCRKEKKTWYLQTGMPDFVTGK